MSVLDFLDAHKSEIAFGAGIIFTGATTVLAVKATPKAMRDIKEAEKELGEPLSRWGKVKACWKRYILPAATEVAGLTCLFFGKSIDMKNTAVAAAAADMSQRLLTEYGKKVSEEIGEKKNEAIKKEVLVDRAKTVSVQPSEDCSLMDGDSWYLEPLFGKKFISSRTKMDAAVNYVNDRLNVGEDVPYNDFFEQIKLTTDVPINRELLCDLGDALGFTPDGGLLEVEYDRQDILVGGQKTVAYVPIYTCKKSGNIRGLQLVGVLSPYEG